MTKLVTKKTVVRRPKSFLGTGTVPKRKPAGVRKRRPKQTGGIVVDPSLLLSLLPLLPSLIKFGQEQDLIKLKM